MCVAFPRCACVCTVCHFLAFVSCESVVVFLSIVRARVCFGGAECTCVFVNCESGVILCVVVRVFWSIVRASLLVLSVSNILDSPFFQRPRSGVGFPAFNSWFPVSGRAGLAQTILDSSVILTTKRVVEGSPITCLVGKILVGARHFCAAHKII